jgi:hypothetical protein
MRSSASWCHRRFKARFSTRRTDAGAADFFGCFPGLARAPSYLSIICSSMRAVVTPGKQTYTPTELFALANGMDGGLQGLKPRTGEAERSPKYQAGICALAVAISRPGLTKFYFFPSVRRMRTYFIVVQISVLLEESNNE